MAANAFRPLGDPLNVTATNTSARKRIPEGSVIMLLSHLGGTDDDHIYYEFGDENVNAVIPAFDGSDGSRALANGSIQTREIPDGATHIAYIAPSDQYLSIETGLGD